MNTRRIVPTKKNILGWVAVGLGALGLAGARNEQKRNRRAQEAALREQREAARKATQSAAISAANQRALGQSAAQGVRQRRTLSQGALDPFASSGGNAGNPGKAGSRY